MTFTNRWHNRKVCYVIYKWSFLRWIKKNANFVIFVQTIPLVHKENGIKNLYFFLLLLNVLSSFVWRIYIVHAVSYIYDIYLTLTNDQDDTSEKSLAFVQYSFYGFGHFCIIISSLNIWRRLSSFVIIFFIFFEYRFVFNFNTDTTVLNRGK